MKKDAEQAIKAAEDANEANATAVTTGDTGQRRQSMSGVEFVRWLGFDDLGDEIEATRRATGEMSETPQG